HAAGEWGPEPAGIHHAAEAKVQAEAPQNAQLSGQPMSLQVPVHRCPASTPGSLAQGVAAFGQVSDLLLKAFCDSREVLLIAGDQRRVGLGSQALGKGEHSGGDRIHVINSKINTGFRAVVARGEGLATLAFEVTILRSDGGLAASPPFGYTLETAGVSAGGARSGARPRPTSVGMNTLSADTTCGPRIRVGLLVHNRVKIRALAGWQFLPRSPTSSVIMLE